LTSAIQVGVFFYDIGKGEITALAYRGKPGFL